MVLHSVVVLHYGFICISLITSEIEQLFICFFDICMSTLLGCQFKGFFLWGAFPNTSASFSSCSGVAFIQSDDKRVVRYEYCGFPLFFGWPFQYFNGAF